MKRLAFSDAMMRAVAAGEKRVTRRLERREAERVSAVAVWLKIVEEN